MMKKILNPLHDQVQAILRKCLILLMLLTAGLSAGAQTFDVGDLSYNVLSETDHTVEVSGFIGEPVNVVIPETVELDGVKYAVTSIGYCAFYNCTSLASVTIPNSVTSIRQNAFDGCTSLASVTIPNSVTNIGYRAFADCTSLVSVTIPDSVTSIGDNAFGGCSSLTSVSIPNSVTSIGSIAFENCTSLSSVTIPNSVTSIGERAFSLCSSLTSVSIPNSVTSIGVGALCGCTSLEEILVDAGNANYCSDNGILYNKNMTELIQCPGAKKEITIPTSVTSIGQSAFEGCTFLASVTIPNSVTSIGGNAFAFCTSLASVTIPNSVTGIERSTFYGCTSLASVTIPNSVTSIGDFAFYGCTSLASVTIPNPVTSIGYAAFSGCTSLKTIYSEPTTPPQAESNAFLEVPTDAVVYVPEGTIGAYSAANEWNRFTDFREKTPTGVSELTVGNDAGPVDVYNMRGMLVKSKASQADVDALAPGMYIIGGRKVLVK